MDEQSVVITIDAEGNIRIEAKGFAGADCLSALEPLKALGTVEDEGHTADWHKRQDNRERVRQTVRSD